MTSYDLPAAFVDRMRMLLGDEAAAFFAAYDRAPRTGLRVNLLKLRPEHMERLSPWPLEPVPWCPSGFFVDGNARPGKHPYHSAGLYYLQEPSAMAVAEALHVRPGMRVLDLAAAPGGKATQIAVLLDNEGLLIANEVESSRIKALGENLERWGARNVVITNDTPERLADHFGAAFDRVLLDAPCSGEGMFRKNVAARAEWSLEHVAGCAIRQGRILEHAARLVAPGGLLVYSTCTFAPEENEQRIATFLREHAGWQLVPLRRYAGFAAGRPEWADPPLPELERTIRLWPHRIAGEGHFIALLRNDQHASEASAPKARPQHERHFGRRDRPAGRVPSAPDQLATRAAIALWQAFERQSLLIVLPTDRLVLRTDQVYLAPKDLPDLGSLRIVRAGLWLGTIKPGRFEPSHALALALQPGDARATVALDDQAVERYLRGETLESAGADGWVIVTIHGWPLGWGRRVGGIVKNFYPKGLRRN